MDNPAESKRKSPWRLGSGFKDGKFYRFDREIIVMTAWPDPRAWYRTKAKFWQPTRKHADRLLSSWDLEGLVSMDAASWLRREVLFARLEHRVGENVAIYESLCARISQLSDLLSPEFDWPDALDPMDRWRLRITLRDDIAATQYVRLIPHAVRQTLQPFSERRWQVMNLLARCPGAMDLVSSSPALTFLLANNWVFRPSASGQHYRSARRLCNRPRKEILEWLGFPAQSLSVLSKFVPGALAIRSMLSLRRRLHDKKFLKVLAHLPQINAGVVQLISSPFWAERASPRLLLDIAQNSLEDEFSRFSPLGNLLRETWMNAHDVGAEVPRQVRNYAHLHAIHAEMSARLQALRSFSLTPDSLFPEPPFPGNASIQPIVSAKELKREGETMRHCVFDRASRIMCGTCYVYRVLIPVRATMSIRRCAGGWELEDVAGVSNQQVEPDLIKHWQDQLFKLCSSTIPACADEGLCNDPLWAQAIELLQSDPKSAREGPVSFLQRHLRIGYERAKMLVKSIRSQTQLLE